MTYLFVVVVVATAGLHQNVEFTLGLKHLSFSLSAFLHMPLHQIVCLLVEEFKGGKNLAQTRLGLVEDLLHIFVR